VNLQDFIVGVRIDVEQAIGFAGDVGKGARKLR
jgi:hypothetical protein